MSHILENITWHALTGPHAEFSVGGETARRYAPGFSPILGFADVQKPDFISLLPHCQVGEHFYCSGWSGQAPSGWRIEVDSVMHQMVWDGGNSGSEPTLTAVRLGREHSADAMALAELTKPGPFGPRTIGLGEYFGYFDGVRLVAMAGERMHAGKLREISGVCTHPDYQGKGLARQLTAKLIFRQLSRGETPFLHVMQANTTAHDLYARMGFKRYSERAVRVVERIG